MIYAHDEKQATALLRQATEFMEQRGIPPNPANFTVWYEHASKENPALGHEVQGLIDGGAALDQQATGQLFDAHFGFAKEGMAITTAGSKMVSTMETVGQDLVRVSEETAGHCERLAVFSDVPPTGQSEEFLMRMVRDVVAQAQEIVAANKSLEAQLTDAAKEIRVLKEDLVTVRDEAMRDPLTGILNRKYLEVRLAEHVELAASDSQDLCVILAGIDDFKTFNETHGHQVGDAALKVVAHAIDEAIRGGDLLGRYGGEQFCVILPSTRLNGGASVAENILSSIASKSLKSSKGDQDFGTISASFGVADYQPGDTYRTLIGRADDALHSAKTGGRNQIVLKRHTAEMA